MNFHTDTGKVSVLIPISEEYQYQYQKHTRRFFRKPEDFLSIFTNIRYFTSTNTKISNTDANTNTFMLIHRDTDTEISYQYPIKPNISDTNTNTRSFLVSVEN